MDFLYREKPGQADSPMREALRILSTPRPAARFGGNPLGLSDETRAKIAEWNARHD